MEQDIGLVQEGDTGPEHGGKGEKSIDDQRLKAKLLITVYVMFMFMLMFISLQIPFTTPYPFFIPHFCYVTN